MSLTVKVTSVYAVCKDYLEQTLNKSYIRRYYKASISLSTLYQTQPHYFLSCIPIESLQYCWNCYTKEDNDHLQQNPN